ncbi:DUF1127 domain-containing protein [Rubellimicrobium aerolatum]|uniref:DUF1127 domain-containing protein n=1 Tax=Rubellimicrobium aerolatum TaxID=490979 RepID=A0ABW0SFP6_9RHOB|nr:DUF1127 domain-containing protein [Rubellimicrobium aerolatum]MBP1807046.1 uncharacterized protein YjiS (DUF1127 family) [Rubellimicrobium aerolatum]
MATTTQDARFVDHAARPVLGGLRAALAQRLARYRLYRQTLDELGSLSDRDLADLGIHRSQIVDIATESAYRA